ncbi:hypothetical protein YC2023_024408 [Brassica napus]
MSPVIPAGSEVYGARQQEGGGGHLVFAPHTICIIVVSLTSVAAVKKGLEYDPLRYHEWCPPHVASEQDPKKKNHNDILELV